MLRKMPVEKVIVPLRIVAQCFLYLSGPPLASVEDSP